MHDGRAGDRLEKKKTVPPDDRALSRRGWSSTLGEGKTNEPGAQGRAGPWGRKEGEREKKGRGGQLTSYKRLQVHGWGYHPNKKKKGKAVFDQGGSSCRGNKGNYRQEYWGGNGVV